MVSPSPTAEVVSGQTLSITCQWSADYTGLNAVVNYRLNDGGGRIGNVLINFGTSCPSTPPYTFTCNRDTRTLGIQIPADSYSHGDRWTCEGRNDNSDSTTPPQTDTTTVDVIVGPGTVTLSPPDTTYTRTEGDTLPDITCTADCSPGCSFVWTKPDNTNFTVSAVLSLGQLDKSEHGTYRCTARNVVGESTTTVTVSVMCKLYTLLGLFKSMKMLRSILFK
ncbi:uncharacterized protein LOC110459580 [Mizuhopecten yessoensis]|uniref:uncharacterized protein LOC110459580 n=1 Tax=Mizuhopecten yessoensis TaxID=6573 RepID=UPI000B457D79|nr:uncharacterized protein LOC110459580 [Mizuhopecten yessoensis]